MTLISAIILGKEKGFSLNSLDASIVTTFQYVPGG